MKTLKSLVIISLVFISSSIFATTGVIKIMTPNNDIVVQVDSEQENVTIGETMRMINCPKTIPVNSNVVFRTMTLGTGEKVAVYIGLATN
jgi:hypothetical protein